MIVSDKLAESKIDVHTFVPSHPCSILRCKIDNLKGKIHDAKRNDK